MDSLPVLTVWTVYFDPSDQPGQYVVRPHHVADGVVTTSPDGWVRPTLDEARTVIDKCSPGLYRQDRSPDDDPAILETWF